MKRFKLGFINGCFDLFHAGHANLIKEAQELCAQIVIGINSDESVAELKGPNRPVESYLVRRKKVAAHARLFDCIVMFRGEGELEELIAKFKPDALIKSTEYYGRPYVGRDYVLQNGGEVIYIDRLEGISTTKGANMLNDDELKTKLEIRPAPRVTKEFIESKIKDWTFTMFDPTVTICNIVLKNGYSVRGESACVNLENYDKEIGNRLAYDDAFKKLWPLFGFMLAEDQHRGYLYGGGKTFQAPPIDSADARGIDFGGALEALKKGHMLARKGWNGKGMFLYLVGPGNYPAATKVAKKYWGENALVPYQSYIAMKTADGTVVPWLASQTDMLATDWWCVSITRVGAE